MNAAGRTPLRILTVAFAASALLVALQTVVFRSLAYDSSAVGTVSVALRVGFLLADALTLIGLLALRRVPWCSRSASGGRSRCCSGGYR